MEGDGCLLDYLVDTRLIKPGHRPLVTGLGHGIQQMPVHPFNAEFGQAAQDRQVGILV